MHGEMAGGLEASPLTGDRMRRGRLVEMGGMSSCLIRRPIL